MAQLLVDVTPFKPILRESKERPGVFEVEGVMQRAGAKNQNGRIYPRSILEREIMNYQKLIQENRAMGECDHPESSVVELKNVSHIVTDMWWEGKDVMGKIKVLDTPSGRILKDLINAGVKLGISSRGLGSVKESMGSTVVQEDFELICFDIVSEPSTPDAYVYPGEPKKSFKFSTRLREQKENNIDNLFKKILGD